MGVWSADSGGGGTDTSGLHLHNPGGLPRSLYLHYLCLYVKECPRSLLQVVEDKGQ